MQGTKTHHRQLISRRVKSIRMLGKLEPSPRVSRDQPAKPLQDLSTEDAFAVQWIKVLDQRSMIQDALKKSIPFK